jgi:uroporphyrinogen-III synthase
MRVLLTRPRPDSEALAKRLQAAGIEALVAPMLEIAPREAPELDLDGVSAIVLTSANGARSLARVSDRRDLRVLAVGEATAAAAQEAGFADVTSADGDSDALATLARDRLDAGAGAVLHVSGAHVAGDLEGALTAAGFAYRRAVLYEAKVAEALPEEAARALRAGSLDGVLLFSPRSARTLIDLVRAAELEGALGRLTAWCLSEAVAGAASPESWRRVAVAAEPRAESLLALVLAGHDPPAPRRWRSAAATAAFAVVASLLAVWLLGPALIGARLPRPPAGLEQRLARLDDQASRLAERVTEAEATGRVEALAARLDSLEAALADKPEAVEPAVGEEIAAVRAAVVALESEVAALAARLNQIDTGGATGAATLLLAVGQLRAAVDAGPFADELAAVAALAGESGEIATLLDPLAAAAETGTVSLETLRARFDRAAVAVLRADAAPAEGGWLDHALAEVKGLVTVRRVGADIAGDGADAVLARAEARLADGDVAGAVALVESLTTAAAAGDWLADARAHAEARAALDALTRAALARAG